MKLKIVIGFISLSFTTFLFANAPGLENRNYFPMGEKELFSANTGTAGFESAGAIYFNPAALNEITQNKLSLSASSYFYFHMETTPQDIKDGQDLNYQSSAFNSVPSSVISVMQFDGATYAFGVMVPQSYALENMTVWTTPSTTIYFEEKMEDSDLWILLSRSKKIDENWAWGLSFMAQKHYQLMVSMITNVNPTGQDFTSNGRSQINVWNSSLILGIQYVNNQMKYGLRVQSPSLRVSGTGDLYSSNTSTTAVNYDPVVINRTDIKANHDVPMDFAFGVNYALTKNFSLMSDISYQLATSFRSLEDPSIDLSQSPEIERKTKAMWRASVAAEFKPNDKIEIISGCNYTPSASIGFEKLDFLGFNLGGYYKTKTTKNGAGIFIANLKGESPVVDNPGRISSTTVSIYGAVLSTSYLF